MLDGVRGVAAVMVVVIHATVLDHPSSFAERAVHRVATLGWLGVDVFFVLSGFLITGILADARGGQRPLRNFYARRVLRIWPLYLAFLAGCLVVVPAVVGRPVGVGHLTTRETVGYWVHLGNLIPAFRRHITQTCWLDVTWSLAVEEHFYLVWPLVVISFSRPTAMRVAAGAVVVAPLFRVGLAALGSSPVPMYVLTPGRIDALGAGAWVALAGRGAGGLAALRPAAGRVVLGAGAGIFALLAAQVAARKSFYPFESAFQTVGYTLFAALFAAVLVRLITDPSHARGPRLLGSLPATAVGKYSYAIYLFHSPIRDGYRALGWGPRTAVVFGSQLPAQFAFYAAVLGTTFGAAWLSWHLFEKHFLRLKQYFPVEVPIPPGRRDTSPFPERRPAGRRRLARHAGALAP
jgi:peptidoglycan/LPS O-acetylase OafA/YrhL